MKNTIKYYKIHFIKPPESKKIEERPEELRGQNEQPIAVDWFKASPQLSNLKTKKKKIFIQKKLKQIPYHKINRKYKYNDKEKVKMIEQGKPSTPIFKGEVKMPENLVKKPTDKNNEKPSNFGDMK